ncbi:MAG: stage 0 sporulation family protein [Candidatus Coprovivens sp.]
MTNIYGVVFKKEGKVYYFNGNDLKIDINSNVVVETERGLQLGNTVNCVDPSSIKIDIDTMKPIVRVATDEDYDNYVNNLGAAEKCLNKAKEIVKELELDMNLIDCNYTLDKKQLLFNFIADERIDFRELAKRLAAIYKTRIELRQIGARDKARTVCGLGQCGRTLCCSSFLNHIDSVTMNMAKNQGLSLNPNKINGQCGRLLCCLTFEDDEYSRCQKGLPSYGQTVKTKYGSGKVVSVDILNRKYNVDIDGIIKEIELEDGKCN